MKFKSVILIAVLAAVIGAVVISLAVVRKPSQPPAQTSQAQTSQAQQGQALPAVPASNLPNAPTPNLPAAPAPNLPAEVAPNGPRVVMDTTMGRITCQFFQKQAPVAVANFIGLATGTKSWTNPTTQRVERHQPLYNGTVFHRVIPGFMIQGGDPTGTGMGSPGYAFDDEFDPNLNFDRAGRLAMANSGPNTNGSQFFITEQPYPSLDQHYTIFGQCDEPSIAVVKAIARVPRDENDKPLTPVVLKKVAIVPVGRRLPPLLPGEPSAP